MSHSKPFQTVEEMLDYIYTYSDECIGIFVNCIQKEVDVLKLTATLKGRMMNVGTMMIGYQPIDCGSRKIPNFFRSIISNAAVQESDIDFMLDELDRLGHDL